MCVGVCQKFSDVYLESNTAFIDTLSDNIAILINSMEVLEPKFISIDILPFVLEIISAYILLYAAGGTRTCIIGEVQEI